MWGTIARSILKNRTIYVIIIALITVFMGYQATRIQLSFEFARVLPVSDETQVAYEKFRKQFGEDGNVMVVGLKDENFFKLDKFRDWYTLSEEIKQISGIKHLLSITHLYNIIPDTTGGMSFKPLLTKAPSTQAEVDSLKDVIYRLPFYKGLIYSKDSTATLMAITFHKKDLDSKNRIDIVNRIKAAVDAYGQKHNIDMHYSGMPFIRSEFMNKVSGEMKLFLILAAVVTALILLLIFRSASVLLYSLGTVAIGVIWALGTISLFGYKITILSGLIPPLILIIGIPNCVFLINKYHSELRVHQNKTKALYRVIEKIGLSLFLANITTAIGFAVFYFTESPLLVEFGVVAAINVMSAYFISLILIPIILSVMPQPAARKTDHLHSAFLSAILSWVERIVTTKRNVIYFTISAMILISLIGVKMIQVNGYVVDDLPKNHPIYYDLRFFEKEFGGVLPFEIAIDTKTENGVFANDARTLYKIKALQNHLGQYEILSKPISLVEAIRFLYQAHKDGKPKYYILPSKDELKKLTEYNSTLEGQEGKTVAFLDSAKQLTRISFQVADIGSLKMNEFVKEIRPAIDSIFEPKDYNVTLTGHSLVFLKNNSYLLKNLWESLLIEIILVTIVGMFLFRSIRIILLSKIPCLIPLIITAGIMGFFSIDFKPSTILIFTIAFGISSDSTIYFLTKYRQELKKGRSMQRAVSETIKETGISMVYSVLILFFGFGVFAFSTFGGTVALGILVATTLLVSLGTNLILLPAILLSLDKYIARKEFTEEQILEIEEDEVTSNGRN